MNFLPAGIALLKEFEGCRLQAYPDPESGGEPWTIGYGSTRDVTPGMVITQEQAEERLQYDSAATAAAVRAALPAGTVLTDNQFTAFVCFAYNVKSWRSRPIFAHLARGDFAGTAAHWLLYDDPGTSVEAGLLRRRKAELAIFEHS